MKNIRYTSLNRIISKLIRDLGISDINESDIIEWSGEALEAINAPTNFEESVAFVKVKNYRAELPTGLHSIIQVARDNNYVKKENCLKQIYEELPTPTSIVEEIICEKIIKNNDTIIENNFPYVSCIPITISYSCPPNETHFSIDFSTFLGGTGDFDNFLNDLLSNPLPRTFSYFELQGYLKANNITILAVNVPTYGTLEFKVNNNDIIDDYNNDKTNCAWHPNIACQNQNGSLQPYMGAFLKFTETIIQTPSIDYKTLTRIITYSDNKIIKTDYKDVFGTTYIPVGEIVNCPDSNCNPCMTSCHKPDIIVLDMSGNRIANLDYANYFYTPTPYNMWCSCDTYRNRFTPIRLSTHSFFDNLVCQEENSNKIYDNCKDEYTLFDNVLKLSFEEGLIAVAYNKQILDNETGYPLIPDTYSYTTAVTKYITYKISEREFYNGRQGSSNRLQKAEQDWHWYCKQAGNELFIPNGIDEYQNLLEQRQYLLPKQNHYYGFFGKFNEPENRKFNIR